MTDGRTQTRVLVLGPLPPPYGGPEVMTRTLLDALSDQAVLRIQHIDMQVSRSLADKGGRRQFRKAWLAMVQTLKLLAYLLLFRPHIVYLPLTNSPKFFGFLRDSLFIFPSLLLRRKVVVRLNGGYYFYVHETGWKRRLVSVLFRHVSLVMVEGRRLVGVFESFVSPDRIVVLPNGQDDRPFAAARAQMATRQRLVRKRVLFVGFLCAEKGVNELFHAIPHVPDTQFVFLGEWPSADDERRAKEFLATHGVAQRAIFRGVLSGPDFYEAFVSADVFAFPTYFVYEGHAVSSVAALAAGLPIVCTDHGALGESVRDGWNGFFVPPRDPAALAARLNELLRDEKLRTIMGQRSRELFLERFTVSRFVDAWVSAITRRADSAGREDVVESNIH
jgi:glycosyltransferase involved in cell wall biosynthesis